MSSLPQSNSQTAARPATPPERLVLIGFMGAGKSTVGRLLAARLGWQFVDTDLVIQQKHGCTVAEMFAEQGEGAFRNRESVALARALGQTDVVIAVGGGAPEILTNRLLLEQTKGTMVVFLDAPFDVLFDRCVLQEGAEIRPVLLDPTAAAERFQLRLPFYRRSAQLCVRTSRQSPEDTATHILNLIPARDRATPQSDAEQQHTSTLLASHGLHRLER
ncbi:MAG: shikimate kinase [Janthinobacterium lividum]